MINLSRQLTTGALAIAGTAVALSFAGSAQAASFLNGTFTGVGFVNNVIKTDGSPFVIPTTNTLTSSGTVDFSDASFNGFGSTKSLSLTSPVPVIAGQSYNYTTSLVTPSTAYTITGVTIGGITGNLTVDLLDSPVTFNLDNGSTSLPFSGSLNGASSFNAKYTFSDPAYKPTFGTISYAYTYSQSVAGTTAPSGSYSVSFTALGVDIPPPKGVPEPSAVLGLLGAVGVGSLTRRRKS